MPVRRPVCLICFVFLFIILAVTGGRGPAPSWNMDAADGITLTVLGTVDEREEKNGTLQIYLSDISVKTDQTYIPKKIKGLVVRINDPDTASGRIKIGARIEARGVFSPFERPRCEGTFDARQYYLIRGYEGSLIRARLLGTSRTYDYVREALRFVRDKAFMIFSENMSEKDAGLVAAMTLGDKTGLEADIKELYQRVGISHILALSGLHIASVGLALLGFLRKAGIPDKISSVISFGFIASYAVMTGFGTSTKRAMIMFGLFVLAGLLGRTYDLMSAASLSAVIILAFDPYYVYDTGFILSFGAVCGIACVFPMLDALPGIIVKYATGRKGTYGYESLFGRSDPTGPGMIRVWIRKIYQAMCISLSVTITTFPVMADSFMQIPVWSVVINLVVIPLMGLVLFTGFAAIVIGFIGIDPGPVLWVTHIILSFFEGAGNIFEKIPGNPVIIGRPSEWQVITYAIIVISAVVAWNIHISGINLITQLRKNVDHVGRYSASNYDSYSKKSDYKISYAIELTSDRFKKILRDFRISCITLVMLIAAIVIITLHPHQDLEIRNIDVGQGDCSLITGESLPVIMIDSGSSDIKQVAKSRVLPVLKANRISRIDYCFLTHMDSDHVNGILEILEDEGCGVSVGTIIVSPGAVPGGFSGDGDDNWLRLAEDTKKRSIDIRIMKAGDVLSLSGSGKNKLMLSCLSPIVSSGRSGESGNDANDSSLVLLLEYKGFSGYFTGDISENVEKDILADVKKCSYLKVAHHGSRYSSCDDFLKKARPEMSVISAGVDNSYGHPHGETIERLKRCGTHIYCTNDSGEVITTYDDGVLKCRKFMTD